MNLPRMARKPALAWIAASLIAAAFSLQYPMTSTFPLGGDAPYYVTTAQATLKSFSRFPPHVPWEMIKSNYPLAHLIFVFSRLLPVSWPSRIIIMTSLVHLLVALTLGWLLKKMAGWPAATLAVIIWSLTTTAINNHFEDSTLAQQFSLLPLLLFVISLLKGKPRPAAIFLLLAAFTHPITGWIMLLASALTLLLYFFYRHQVSKKYLVAVSVLLLALLGCGGFILYKYDSLALIPSDTESVSWPNLVRSFYGPFILTAPLGLIGLASNKAYPTYFKLWFILFLALAILTTFNGYLGIGFWTARFQTYFILITAILSALSLPDIARRLAPSALLSPVLPIIILVPILYLAWINHGRVYAWYESPSHYGRLHAQELEAIDWISFHLNESDLVYSSTATRHAEWIPAMSRVKWQPLQSLDDAFLNDIASTRETGTSNRYVAYFTRVESIPPLVEQSPTTFPIAFHNDSVVIISLSHAPD